MKKKEVWTFPLKGKYVAMLAPSFVVDFPYPKIILQLRALGFDKIVELTFGAKMVNREYLKQLKNAEGLIVASVCPGVVETIKKSFPRYKKNLIQVDSPMIATAKICRKTYPQHKIVFISPCHFKKIEAKKSNYVDFVIDYKELKNILMQYPKKKGKGKMLFDKFYNDYTKIYPIAGGLSRTAHLKKILKNDEVKIIGGIEEVSQFLRCPDKKIRFLDATFCNGSCVGGPCINSRMPIKFRRRKVLHYLKRARREDIPEVSKGLIKKAGGISFKSNFVNT
jgi:iron only hydrogenase large subunit-like protein